MDDSMGSAVREAVRADLERPWADVTGAADGDPEAADGAVRDGVLAVGARVLAAGLAARGGGKAGARRACPCGGSATFEGHRPKGVQTVVGWITIRRAYYACAACGRGHCPLDAVLGVSRGGLGPGVRRLASQLGALLPFAGAARAPEDTARVRLSASTVRGVTEAVGARREAAAAAEIAAAWRVGLPLAPGAPPDRLYLAMDGVRILGADGAGHEVKVGVVVPARRGAGGDRRELAGYAAGLESAAAFGPRLALEAHRRGLERAGMVAVLGDGAEWIWNLAAAHFPTALRIVDWFHASERVWEPGRALYGEDTAETAPWVAAQLDRLAQGQAATLAAGWRALPGRGAVIAVRDARATYFANQAPRMAYDRYRAAGWDIGSGMAESACKRVIAAREKGAGMRWSEAGARTVAAVRGLLLNGRWATHDLAA